MEHKLISVIIPTYKSRGGLKRSIDSVLSQTYSNLEIIVVDDNDPNTSERKTTENIMHLYDNNPIVIYIKHEHNKNGAAARNTGIKLSKGNYIAFLDDDDEWLPDKIEKEYDYLITHPEKDAVYTYIINRDGIRPWTIPYEGNALIPLLSNRSRMYTSSLLMTKSSILSIGGFDESFKRHQDYEFLVRFFMQGYTIGCLKEALIKYTPLGGNAPIGHDFIILKEKYLANFDALLDRLEAQYAGIKADIVASNYAIVFYNCIAHRQLRLATQLFMKWFPVAPIAFLSQIVFFLRGKIYRFKQKIVK